MNSLQWFLGESHKERGAEVFDKESLKTPTLGFPDPTMSKSPLSWSKESRMGYAAM